MDYNAELFFDKPSMTEICRSRMRAAPGIGAQASVRVKNE